MIQGLILSAGAIMFLWMSGNIIGDTSAWVNLKSGALVLGGSLVSIFLAYSTRDVKELYKNIVHMLKREKTDCLNLVKQITSLAYLRRRYGNKQMESEARKMNQPFLLRGVELVADGYDRFEIRNILEQEFDVHLSRQETRINMLNTLRKLAPAFGFVGTIIGLIHVLGNIGEPAEIGRGMAQALLTTFYGLIMANFIFLPLSHKLAEETRNQSVVFNLILEGVVDIAEERNSKYVAHRLKKYLVTHQLVSLPDKKSTPARIRKKLLPSITPAEVD